jgi:hypothetical protein
VVRRQSTSPVSSSVAAAEVEAAPALAPFLAPMSVRVPVPAAAVAAMAADIAAAEETRANLRDMGFDEVDIDEALDNFGKDAGGAVNWLLSGKPPIKKKASVLATAAAAAAAAAAATAAVATPALGPKPPPALSLFHAPSKPKVEEPAVMAGLSLMQITSQYLVHRAVFQEDYDSLREFAKIPELLRGRDGRGRTPLQLAHALGLDGVVFVNPLFPQQ